MRCQEGRGQQQVLQRPADQRSLQELAQQWHQAQTESQHWQAEHDRQQAEYEQHALMTTWQQSMFPMAPAEPKAPAEAPDANAPWRGVAPATSKETLCPCFTT